MILVADRPVGNYWLDVSTLDGRNSPVVLHYVGAPAPLSDPALAAAGPRMQLGCLLPADGGSGGAGSHHQQGSGFLDLSRGAQLPAHPSLPRPPRLLPPAAWGSTVGGPTLRRLVMYLVQSSDPATAQPSDLLGAATDKEGGGSMGRVPSMSASVHPMVGCPDLPGGVKNR